MEDITSFAQFPDNRATNSPAPDFSARLLEGGDFVLSAERGTYWLILPTSMGCGECMYSLSMVSQAQPEEPSALNVLVLDIYEPDDPAYWGDYRTYFDDLEARWGVVNQAADFLAAYGIFGLGDFLIVDPQGRLVYQSDSPPPFPYVQHFFTLTCVQGEAP